MFKKKIISGFIILSALSISTISSASDFNFNNLSTEQKNEISEYVSKYLVENPEFLINASKNLENKTEEARKLQLQEKAKVANLLRKNILENENTPIIGNKDADVKIVLFSDYNCGYCLMFNEVLKTVENNKDIGIFVEELPILGEQVESSFIGANIGTSIYKEKGSDTYSKFHNDIYDFVKKNKSLKNEDIVSIAQRYGYNPKNTDLKMNLDVITPTFNLANKLGVVATPTFIVYGKDPTKTRIIEGYVDKENLQEIINSVK